MVLGGVERTNPFTQRYARLFLSSGANCNLVEVSGVVAQRMYNPVHLLR